MKKVLGILLALVLVLAFSVPALADVTTHVEVVGDDAGSPPIIKAKWEKFSHYTDSGSKRAAGEPRGTYTPAAPPTTYDDNTVKNGIQVFAPGLTDPQGEIDIEYWAVVTDPQGLDDIVFVSADVYHPTGWPPPHDGLKYEVMMLQVYPKYWLDPNKADAIAEMTAADAAGAITYNEILDAAGVGTGVFYTLDDLIFEYEQNEAWMFMGVEWLDYHQPHGCYTVELCVADQGLKKDYKTNEFEYVKETCIKLDFETLDFGQVLLCKEVPISGDDDMETPLAPTVKNLGNCNCRIWVHFDDMGLGWRTENDKQVPNVTYDARLDLFTPKPVIYPCKDTRLDGELPLCTKMKLSFSIHVTKAEPGSYNGTCTIWAIDP